MKTDTFILSLLLALAFLTDGCIGQKPLRPGHSTISAGDQSQTIVQPENPAAPSTQDMDSTVEKDFTVPTGSLMATVEKSATATNTTTIKASEPMPVRLVETHHATATVGAAQKDVSRELTAKFQAVRPVQYVGVLLILVAAALCYFGWYTKAAIVGGIGIGMIVVAALIPGHELLIIGCGVALAVIGAFVVLYVYHRAALDQMIATGEADAKKAIGAVESLAARPATVAVAIPTAPIIQSPTAPAPAVGSNVSGPLS